MLDFCNHLIVLTRARREWLVGKSLGVVFNGPGRHGLSVRVRGSFLMGPKRWKLRAWRSNFLPYVLVLEVEFVDVPGVIL